jgi:DNA polymerase elongation subunit (family B)
VTPAEREPFPPTYAWRPICIGAVLLEEPPSGSDIFVTKHIGVMEELLAGTDAAAVERSVLGMFSRTMNRKGRQTVVSWNGRGYDLPVLIQRSMRYGIAHPWYFERDVRYRYSEEGHCDLADAIGDFGAAQTPKLDGVAKLIGLPGKFGDIDGAAVGEAFAAGRLRDIGTYCMSDAVQTAFIWLRWLVLKGRLSVDGYRASAEGLLRYCATTGRLVEFTKLVDRRVLLLETEARAAAQEEATP